MNGWIFLTAVTSLSTSPLFVKWSGATVEFLGFWRMLFAGLLILVGMRLKLRDTTSRRLRTWVWPSVAGIFFFLHLWTYSRSAQTTSIAHLMILFAVNPVFTVLGAALFFDEKLKKRLILVYPLAFLGLWILVREKVSNAPESQWGDALAILSGFFHAAYLLASKQARKTIPNLEFSMRLYLVTGLFFGITAVARGIPLFADSTHGWLGVTGLILFPTFLGHALMTQLVGRINVGVLSCGKLIEPGLSSLMAFVVLGESISSRTAGAFLLTATAVMILFWPLKRQTAPAHIKS